VMGVFSGWGEEASQTSGEKDSKNGVGLVQKYLGGTLCEGWGRRETEVHFLCDKEALESPRILNVEEPSVCKYTMTVATVHACE